MSDEQKHAKSESHGHGDHGGGGGGHGGGGHGGGGSHEEHEGAPEWLISFADNVTLMMGFFVILLAMNLKPAATGTGSGDPSATEAQESSSLDFAIAVRQAFHNPVDLDSIDLRDLPLIRRLMEREGESRANQRGPQGREHDVKSIRPGTLFTQGGRITFERGAAMLSASAVEMIGQIASVMKGVNFLLEVRGHVSSAEAFQIPDRGVELSFQRARTVASALTAAGMDWKQMRIVACADGDRLQGTAYSDAEHTQNQRVEVRILDEVMPLPMGHHSIDGDGP